MRRRLFTRYLLAGLAQATLLVVFQSVCAFSILLLSSSSESAAGEAGTALPAGAGSLEETNSPTLLRALFQLQGQLLSNQAAIDQNERDAREAAVRNAEALSNGLQNIADAFAAQQQTFSARSGRELEAMRSSHRTMFALAGALCGMAFLATLLTAYFQWRMSKLWSEISTMLPLFPTLGRDSSFAALATAEQTVAGSGPAENSNLRLMGAMERLEKRIRELEQGTRADLDRHSPSSLSGEKESLITGPPQSNSNGGAAAQQTSNGDSPISELLRQAQEKLTESDLEEAVRRYDEVLALDANHPEALVRKGATLERLKKLNEAFECYDRAIAADRSMTLAYLHKGRLCNRLERFKEALECYEQALRTQEEWRG